jgi:superoxide reductase
MRLQGEPIALTCCGHPMELLKPGSTDGAQEKHVPVIIDKVKDCNIAGACLYDVQVGSIEHPMLPEH